MAEESPEVAGAVGAYLEASKWRDTATLVASDALYGLCCLIIERKVSAREVARRIGVSKSWLAERVNLVREQKWPHPSVPNVDESAFAVIHREAYGFAAPAPFRRVSDPAGDYVEWVTDEE